MTDGEEGNKEQRTADILKSSDASNLTVCMYAQVIVQCMYLMHLSSD